MRNSIKTEDSTKIKRVKSMKGLVRLVEGDYIMLRGNLFDRKGKKVMVTLNEPTRKILHVSIENNDFLFCKHYDIPYESLSITSGRIIYPELNKTALYF